MRTGSERVSEPLTDSPNLGFQSLRVRVPCMCPQAPLCPQFLCVWHVSLSLPPFPAHAPAQLSACTAAPSSSLLPFIPAVAAPLAFLPSPLPPPHFRPPPTPAHGLVSLHWTRLTDGFSLRNLCVIAPPPTSSCPSPQPQRLWQEIETRGLVVERGYL